MARWELRLTQPPLLSTYSTALLSSYYTVQLLSIAPGSECPVAPLYLRCQMSTKTPSVIWLGIIYFLSIYWLSMAILVRSPRHRHISHVHSSGTPGVFYTYFYNHAHRLRLEKLLYLELPRSSNGFFKPLLDPGGGFRSETAVTKPFRK